MVPFASPVMVQLVVALVMVPGALLLVLGVMMVELAAQVAGVVT